jgi:hypothetical protein
VLEEVNVHRELIERGATSELGLDLCLVTTRACRLSPAGSFVFLAADSQSAGFKLRHTSPFLIAFDLALAVFSFLLILEHMLNYRDCTLSRLSH